MTRDNMRHAERVVELRFVLTMTVELMGWLERTCPMIKLNNVVFAAGVLASVAVVG